MQTFPNKASHRPFAGSKSGNLSRRIRPSLYLMHRSLSLNLGSTYMRTHVNQNSRHFVGFMDNSSIAIDPLSPSLRHPELPVSIQYSTAVNGSLSFEYGRAPRSSDIQQHIRLRGQGIKESVRFFADKILQLASRCVRSTHCRKYGNYGSTRCPVLQVKIRFKRKIWPRMESPTSGHPHHASHDLPAVMLDLQSASAHPDILHSSSSISPL